MKQKIMSVALTLMLVAGNVIAQNDTEKGLAVINRSAAEAHIGFLAADELSGRFAGTSGGRVASNYIVSQLQQIGVAPLLPDGYFQPFEAGYVNKGQRHYWEMNPDSLAYLSDAVSLRRSMRNVLGVIQGKRSDEYVVIGAHYDHIGIAYGQKKDSICNGADDNASGVSAVLQLARAFVASGQKPERTIVFAFWDGEEHGLLGSKYFVSNHDFGKNICAYLNYDMIGRNKYPERPWHVVYFYTEAHPDFGKWLSSDIKKYKLHLEPDYCPKDKLVGGSDNASFALRNVPVIWYHTDGHPDYHQPTDHSDRINYDKLVEITKASFLAAWRLANDSEY